jgi:GTP-binding protein
MMAQVIARIPSPSELVEPEADLRLAIVGRTNVGKSMLLNTMSEQERAIVSGVPGTTRDALDTLMLYGDRRVLLIDTAGIRRSGRIVPGIERYSVLRSVRAIDRADVVILLMDAAELATSQDTHIAGYVLDSYKGIILAVNKWDLAPRLEMAEEDALKKVAERFNFASYAPVSFVSALEGFGIDELVATAFGVYAHWTKSLPRYDLRRTVLNAVAEHPPSMSGRRSLKVYSVTQDRTGPPSFTFYVNNSDMVHFSYQRYLENALRNAYGFEGAPLRMRFRSRGER